MQPKESKTNYHFYFSTTKSVIRILASIELCFGNFIISGIMLIIAEILGIIEEL
jgi:hypothetical protein